MSRALAVVAALLFAQTAGARPTVGLRLAYAPSLGSAAEELPMSEVVPAQFPLQADALWRVGPVSAGAYLSWGPAEVPSRPCQHGAECSGSVLRLGLQAQYAFRALGRVGIVPWTGIGAGYERAAWRRERLGSETSFTWSGFEALLQAGADLPLGRGFSAGPFVQLAVGRYDDVALDTSASAISTGLGEKALHGFVHVGLRGKLDL